MSAIPWTVCERCLQPTMLLIEPDGGSVTVDPEPTAGGPLLVNGEAGRVIGRNPPRGSGRREVGWWDHVVVCRGTLPPRRPDPLPAAAPHSRPALRPPPVRTVVSVDGVPGSRRQRAPR